MAYDIPYDAQNRFSSIIRATKKPKGLTVTCVTNWLIKPFTMYLISAFFF